jgi:hypothetical protein
MFIMFMHKTLCIVYRLKLRFLGSCVAGQRLGEEHYSSVHVKYVSRKSFGLVGS